ncbi:uncharacterized protein CMC5_013200 [Chondromyces crocatus]|uniref:Tox-ART-HYD1 domain-containing protein n=2 Tax=Chondromyces crocatus TaxID=52 RepID=A0A0K1E8K7_CHOCO|nr:hypothetical protein [Chondromyces crocatus]AKT37190.1 uncharacterized protein CMC5_013200 [Chondromyces crocatus]
MLTAEQILNELILDSRVFLHYTSSSGLSGIMKDGVIQTDGKYAVYFSQEPMSPDDVHTKLLIGATTHEGRGTHLLVIRVDSGIPIETTGYHEVCVRQRIRLDQHMVLYHGPNPF